MKVFLDSSVIIRANDRREPHKQLKAIDRISTAMREGNGAISTQVLAEYARVAVHNLRQEGDVIMRQLQLLERLEVVQLTSALVRRGLELHRIYKLGYDDATILAAAESAHCSLLLSEDLDPGKLYSAVRVENPFSPSDGKAKPGV